MLSLIGLPSGDFSFVDNLAYKYDIIVRLRVTFARCIMQSFDLRSKGLGEQRMLAKTLEEWARKDTCSPIWIATPEFSN